MLNHAKLAATELPKLTPTQLEAWRKSLKELPTRSGGRRGQRRSDSTLNRDMTCFRAALNLAYLDGLLTTDFAWRSKLRPIKNADQRRELYLDRAQRIAFIEKAPTDLGAFLRGLCQLPLRPGALAKLKAGDFDRRLKVLKIGQDKSGKDRRIKLPNVTAEFFETVSKDKLPTAPLLSRADGKAWNKDAWKGPVKTAAEAPKLPDGTTAYTLRHSVISDLVHDGLDLLTVAQISGTSVAMIERHYGHLRSDVAAVAPARLALKEPVLRRRLEHTAGLPCDGPTLTSAWAAAVPIPVSHGGPCQASLDPVLSYLATNSTPNSRRSFGHWIS